MLYLVSLILFICILVYVFIRSRQCLTDNVNLRSIYSGVYWGLFIMLMIGSVLKNISSLDIVRVTAFIGYSFVVMVLYMSISFLIVDIIRIADHYLHFAGEDMMSFRRWFSIISVIIIACIMVWGNYKFNHPEIVNLDIATNKSHKGKEIKIVAASDFHLGSTVDKKRLSKYVSMINEQKPDVVVLLGDVVDLTITSMAQEKIQYLLRDIKAPKGVYAILGNHEYYSGRPLKISSYLQESGIIVLRDSSCIVDSSFYLVGRDDRSNYRRKSLYELMQGLDRNMPVILLDHQPYNLKDAYNNGIDLQLSGHTHDGQLFPGNILVRHMFELAHGFMQKGNTKYYVSSGLGIWGPQYRIGTQSELVVINFRY